MNRDDADVGGAARQRVSTLQHHAAGMYADTFQPGQGSEYFATAVCCDCAFLHVHHCVKPCRLHVPMLTPDLRNKPRKKGRLPAPPVPELYLPTAPPPTTAAEAPSGGLVLPSDHVRAVNAERARYANALASPPMITASNNSSGYFGSSSPRPLATPVSTPLPATGYITNLRAPPLIVSSRRPASPLPQNSRPVLPTTGSSRSMNRDDPSGGTTSPMPGTRTAEPTSTGPTRNRADRRSRVVNNVLSRRPTVSNREDHFLRRASMRRTNVWDGES